MKIFWSARCFFFPSQLSLLNFVPKMSFAQDLYIKSLKGRILKRIHAITEESQTVISYLNGAVFEFQERARVLSGSATKEDFFEIYEKLKQDLEAFEEKFFFVQTCCMKNVDGDETEPFFDCITEGSIQDNPQLLLNAKCSEVNQLKNKISTKNSNNEIAQLSRNSRENLKSCDSSESGHLIEDNHAIFHFTNNLKDKKDSSNHSMQYSQIVNNSSENIHSNKNSVEGSMFSNCSSYAKLPENIIQNNHFSNSSLVESENESIKSNIRVSNENALCFDSSDVKGKLNTFQFESTNEKYSPSDIDEYFIKLSSASQKSDSQNSLYESLSSFTNDVPLPNQSSTNYNALSFATKPPNVQENHFNNNASKTSLSSSHNSAGETDIKKVYRTLLPFNVPVPGELSAVVTHVVDPGNFWMRVENCQYLEFCTYALCTFDEAPCCTFKNGDFCLAPFQNKVLCRAVIQSISYAAPVACAFQEEEMAKVFFVDHGLSHRVLVKSLRQLPEKVYAVPMLAIHCHLAEAYPVEETWCDASTKEFKHFLQNYSIQCSVLSKEDDKYGVQLSATSNSSAILATLDEGFACDIDIATVLRARDLALDSKKHHTKATKCLDINNTVSFRLGQTLGQNYLDNTIAVSNRISCDSGVSVTSNHDTNSPIKEQNISTDSITDNFTKNIAIMQDSLDAGDDDNARNANFHSSVTNHQSSSNQTDVSINSETRPMRFDSYSGLTTAANDVVYELKHMDIYPTSDLSIRKRNICDNDLLWEVIVPKPSITFVEKNMMLVMMSHIYDPSDFYVHLAQENSSCLDDLHEQMTETYTSMQHFSYPKLMTEILLDGIYCSAPFEQDGNWYRSKILDVDKQKNIVKVQFIDYGNESLIPINQLRPLTQELAKYPAFALKCSLALVQPVSKNSHQATHQKNLEIEAPKWTEYSISTFKELTGYDNCLTAQVLEEVDLTLNDGIQILLWDNQGSHDLCLNELLVEKKAAEFIPVISDESEDKSIASQEISHLNGWDPMEEDYNDPENTYGVDAHDLEIATVGYKANDEKYLCRYYSRNGYCPRSSCDYRHEVMDVDGTLDQVETIAYDCVPPLPEISTYFLLEISAIVNPGHFYAVFPFGSKTVDEIDDLIRNGASMKDIVNLEPKCLSSAMSKYYNRATFTENTKIALAEGNIVVAKSSYDDLWHRARVISVQEIAAPVVVFFVDRGYREIVERKSIREILPEYTHMPFQAVECLLSDVEPKNFERNCFWSDHSRNFFQKIVENKILLSFLVHKDVSKLYLTLKNTTESDHQSISELLIEEGYAQPASYKNNVKDFKRSTNHVYLPG